MKLRFQLRTALQPLFVLILASSCLSQIQDNPYNKMLQDLVDRWATLPDSAKPAQLERIARLRDFVSDPAEVSKRLSEVASRSIEARLVRDEANWHLAQVAVHEARLDDARKFADGLGFVRNWSLLKTPTCENMSYSQSRPVKANPLGTIVLHGPSRPACVATTLYTSTPKTVALRFSADGAFKLLVNGAIVAAKAPTAMGFDQSSFGLELPAGWTTVAFQLESGTKELAVRTTAPKGGGLWLSAVTPRAILTAVRPADVVDLPGSATQYASAVNSPQTVAELEGLRGLREGFNFDPDKAPAQRWLASAIATNGPEASRPDLTRGTPIWLRRELALNYRSAGETGKANLLLNQVWKSSFDDERVRTALVALAEQRHDEPALRMLAQAGEVLDPMNPQLRFDAAQNTAHDTLPALQEIAKTVQEDSLRVRYAAWTALGSRSSEPSSPHFRTAEYITRPFAAVVEPTVDEDSFLVDPARLADDARRNVPRDNANVITLADVSVEHVQKNGQSSLRVQQVFYVANERGARDYSTRSVQYSSATQRLTMLGARMYKADGRVVEAEDAGENSVADPSIAMYYDTRAHSMRFPDLQKGDVMSIEYRVDPKSDSNPWGNYFGALVAFQNGLPQHLRRYVLIAPKGLTLNIVEQRMPSKAIVIDGGTEIVRSWEARNVPPLAIEARGPALTELAPYVSVSTFSDWNQVGRWYTGLITPQFQLDSELKSVMATLELGNKTELEKIHAIHQFVLRNTHYVAMEFGVYSYKPYPVSQVYARRFGDCKDKASLMVALMRAAGIDAEFALVRTKKLGDVSESATTLAIFNHAVVYVPKYDLWLDGTADYAGSRELPLDDQGAMALTVNLDGNATLRRIPITLPMQNYTHRVVTAQVHKDGRIQFSGTSYTRGEDAPGLRREYEITDRQRDSLRANLAQVYPSVQVDSVHVEGAHDLERDINVHFSGSLDKFAGDRDVTLSSSWMPNKYVDSLAPQESRSQDLVLPAPWTTEEELHFQIPEGATVESVPTNKIFNTAFGTATIHYEQRERELFVTTSVQFRSLRISPADYSGFRAFCTEVEKLFGAQVKLRLAS